MNNWLTRFLVSILCAMSFGFSVQIGSFVWALIPAVIGFMLMDLYAYMEKTKP